MNIQWPTNIQSSMQETLDTIMTNVTGRQCTLYFPPVVQASSGNLVLPADISANTWAAGNPLPLHSQQGLTPYVDTLTPTISVEPTGIVTMVIYWKPQRFLTLFPIGERKTDGFIVTRGFATDLPAILNCTKMETFNELGTDHYQYRLAGEAVSPGKIIPNRYFFAIWDRC